MSLLVGQIKNIARIIAAVQPITALIVMPLILSEISIISSEKIAESLPNLIQMAKFASIKINSPKEDLNLVILLIFIAQRMEILTTFATTMAI